MKQVNRAILFTVCTLLAPLAQAEPNITVNGFVSAELAPPSGSGKSDAESGAPLGRDAVFVADELPGAWKYSALADISVPKLAILGSLDNSAGGAMTGAFGGEIPLMRVNASLRDTISITAPSSDPYLVSAELVVDGVLQVDGSNGTVIAQFDVLPVNKLSTSVFRTYDTSGTVVDDHLVASYQFSGDAVFDLRSSLFFFVNQVDAGASVLADFSNTAIVHIVVTTLGGDPIEGVQLNSESGSFGVAPVPVPAALPLLLSGLAAVGWRARRRA